MFPPLEGGYLRWGEGDYYLNAGFNSLGEIKTNVFVWMIMTFDWKKL